MTAPLPAAHAGNPGHPHVTARTPDQASSALARISDADVDDVVVVSRPQDPGPLVERDDALGVIADAMSSTVDGVGAAVLVDGPPGIGKTALLRATMARAERCGFQVLYAAGAELEHELAFGVVRSLFTSLLRTAIRHGRNVLDGPVRHAAGALGLGEATETSDGPASDAAVLHALHWLCADLSEERPLMLVVDDAQWADLRSLRFIAYLARRVADLPIVLILATRPAGGGDHLGVLDHVMATDTVRVLRPASLSPSGVATLVRSHLPESSPEMWAACSEVTGGNPLLVRELIAELTRHTPRGEVDAAEIRRMGSAGIARMTLSRLAGMRASAPDVARAVSVLGNRAQVRRVATLTGLEVDEVERAVRDLVAANILDDTDPLSFQHPMVRRAVYELTPAAVRARQHALTARLLSADSVPDEDVATHLLHAEPGDDAEVVGVLRRAAANAARVGAPDVSITYLRRALQEADDSVRAEVLVELAEAEARVLERASRQHARRALETAKTLDVRVRAAVALARSLVFSRRWTEADSLLSQTVESLPADDVPARLRLETERLWPVIAGHVDAASLATRIAQLNGYAVPDSPAERFVCVLKAAHGLTECAPAAELADLAQRALQDGRLLLEHRSESPVWATATAILITAGAYDAAEVECRRAAQDAARIGSAIAAAQVATIRAWIRIRVGDLRGTESSARFAIDLMEQSGYPLAAARFSIPPLAVALAVAGRPEEADRLIAQVTPPPDVHWDRTDAQLMHARGFVRLMTGAREAGVDDLLAVGRWCDERGFVNPADWPWRTDVAPALAASDLPRARSLATEDLRCARRTGIPLAVGRALHATALVEDPAEGLPLLEEAIEVLASSGARLAHAMALHDAGAALRRGGQPDRARRLLADALDLAASCGAETLTRRVRAELAQLGARPRRTAVTGPDALTPSERRVCELATEGLSNREIAVMLFLSVKTVEKHLGAAYRKLGVERRQELREALVRRAD